MLDIKGVCDDGIDTLEPQLEPICEWIDRARMEGGQVLVHCRVGVSRSATVTVSFSFFIKNSSVLRVRYADCRWMDGIDRLRHEAPRSASRRRVPHRPVAQALGPHPAEYEAVV